MDANAPYCQIVAATSVATYVEPTHVLLFINTYMTQIIFRLLAGNIY